MSRVIKFRLWDKVNKEMIYLDESNAFITGWGHLAFGIIGKIKGRDIDDFEVMQFTGLTDKNGVEIYEGDIVSFHNRMHEVCINFNGYYLQRYKLWRGEFVPAFKYAMSLITKPNGKVESAEVIGNVFENRDLLVKKEG